MIYRFDEDFDEEEEEKKDDTPSFLHKLNPFNWLKPKKEKETFKFPNEENSNNS